MPTTPVEIILASLEAMPTYGTLMAAAFDLRVHSIQISSGYTPDSVNPEIEMQNGNAVLRPGYEYRIDTGVKIQPGSFCVLVIPRSGLGTKHGLELVNTVGLIDPDYQGNIYLTVRVSKPLGIERGHRIAQGILLPVIQAEFIQVENFSNVTERGENGHGSTGV